MRLGPDDRPLPQASSPKSGAGRGDVGHRELEYALEDLDIELYAIGDSQAARTAEEPIAEGMEVSMSI